MPQKHGCSSARQTRMLHACNHVTPLNQLAVVSDQFQSSATWKTPAASKNLNAALNANQLRKEGQAAHWPPKSTVEQNLAKRSINPIINLHKEGQAAHWPSVSMQLSRILPAPSASLDPKPSLNRRGGRRTGRQCRCS